MSSSDEKKFFITIRCYSCKFARLKKKSPSVFFSSKVQSEFTGISAELLYDVIHDGQFRSTWDTAMLEGYEICSVLPNSDIGYYSSSSNFSCILSCLAFVWFLVKSPPPFKNRDFVTQRCWLDFGRNSEKYIINHSVNYLVTIPRMDDKNILRSTVFFSSERTTAKKLCTGNLFSHRLSDRTIGTFIMYFLLYDSIWSWR